VSSSEDSIDAFLQAVAARLPGPTRSRGDILAELRDGLIEAANANQRAGLRGEQAVRLAVQKFGSPQDLADSLCPEIASAQGRRIARSPVGRCACRRIAVDRGRSSAWPTIG
jgi:hypothetical protein